jgi:hypothetical protein
LTRCLQKVQGAYGIGVKIIEGNVSCPVVRRLSSAVNDDVRLDSANELRDLQPVPNVDLMVIEIGQGLLQAVLNPPGITLRSEKGRPLIVVNSVDIKSFGVKIGTHLGSY